MTLSQRGRGMVSGSRPDYLVVHEERRGTPGYLSLAVAENKLMWDLVGPRLNEFPPAPAEVSGYGDMRGSEDLRQVLARLLERHVLGRPVDPDQLYLMAGASAILDAVAAAIVDPGDGVIVHTPSYAGFWWDLELRAQARVVTADARAEDGFALTADVLDAAYDKGGPVRALLYTNPDNPLGRVATADEVRAVVDWTTARGIQLVADELYALSVFGRTPFTSVGSIRPTLGQDTHLVWALSKDFSMSGLRCGVLLTEDAELGQAVMTQAIWSAVSGHTQWVLARMLEDESWVETYLAAMRSRLGAASAAVGEALDAARMPSIPGEAGFFRLVDLRSYLDAPTFEAEGALWRRIVDHSGVNMTPGQACRATEPGFFRLCFAASPTDVVVDAIERMGKVLRG